MLAYPVLSSPDHPHTALSLCHSQVTAEKSEGAKGSDDPDRSPASYENLGKVRALSITQCPS